MNMRINTGLGNMHERRSRRGGGKEDGWRRLLVWQWKGRWEEECLEAVLQDNALR